MRKVFNIPLVDWAWILALTLWRICISSRHSLGVDEAHYALYGLRPDLSYFDHPPLVGWVQAVFVGFFGKHEVIARLPAVICGVFTSVLIYKLILKIFENQSTARWAAIALNISFLPAALWFMFLPDTLLFVFALWLANIVGDILERDQWSDWISLGICMGLCGLTKYTAIFFVISLAGIVTTEKAWARINWPRFITAIVISVIFVIPVFYWNMKHDWISFSYQQNHVLGHTEYRIDKFFTFFVTQLLAYSPFLIIASIMGLWSSRRQWTSRIRVCLWIALPTLIFFAYSSLKDEVLPHWTLVGWGFVIPLGIAEGLDESYAKWTKRSVYLTGAIIVFVLLELTFVFLKLPPYQSPYADLIGWPELHDEIKNIVSHEPAGSYSIGVTNWTHGSRANYYLDDVAPVFVLDDRFDQFDLWEGGPPKTPNIIILKWRNFDLSTEQASHCEKIEPVETKVFSVNGNPVNSVDLLWCRNYKPTPSH